MVRSLSSNKLIINLEPPTRAGDTYIIDCILDNLDVLSDINFDDMVYNLTHISFNYNDISTDYSIEYKATEGIEHTARIVFMPYTENQKSVKILP